MSNQIGDSNFCGLFRMSELYKIHDINLVASRFFGCKFGRLKKKFGLFLNFWSGNTTQNLKKNLKHFGKRWKVKEKLVRMEQGPEKREKYAFDEKSGHVKYKGSLRPDGTQRRDRMIKISTGYFSKKRLHSFIIWTKF